MSKFIRKYKAPLLLFGTITLLLCLIVGPYLLTKTPFILGWDMRTQYSLFYENLKTMIQESVQQHSLPFYSWSTFLGNNFWANKLFYYHDIFDYLSILLKNVSYSHIIILQTCIKLMIAGFSFYFYSSKRNHSSLAKVVGSLCFAFSAWSLEALKDPFFLSFYIFLPLYFYAIDQYQRQKKKLFFIFITCFLVITNYYSFYSLSLFTVLYFTYHHYKQFQTLKGLMKQALPLIGYYLIGVALAGIVIVPELMAILANNRVGKSSAMLLYASLQPYFAILTGLFTPSSMLLNHNNDFVSIYQYISQNNTVLAVCLWSGSFSSLLLPQLFIKKKKENVILYLTLLVLMLIPFGSSLMHGLSEPAFRWLQLVTFLNITLILPFLDDLTIINKKVLLHTLSAICLLQLGVPLLLQLIYNTPWSSFFHEYFTILTVIPFLFLAYFLLRSPHPKKSLILIFTVVELGFVSYFSVYGNSYYRQFSQQTIQGVENVLLKKNDLNQYLLTLDEKNKTEFYRIFVPTAEIYWDYSTNLNLKYNIMGLMSYDSTYSPSIIDMNQIKLIDSYLPWSFEIQDPHIMDYLSVKYAIVTDSLQLPHANYKVAGEFNGLAVYENLNYRNLLTVSTELLSYQEYQLHPDTSKILTTVLTDSSQVDEIKAYLGTEAIAGMDWVVRYQNSLQGEVTLRENGFGTLAIPYDGGWKVKVNQQQVNTYRVNGGTLGFPLVAGTNYIELYFVPQGFKLGCFITLLGIVGFFILAVKQLVYRK